MQIKFTAVFISFVIFFVSISNCFYVSATEQENDVCFVLVEAESKVIISSSNENNLVPVGVMSKLMTVYLAAEEINNGKLCLNDTLKASTYANSVKGATIWLMPNEEITVDELLKAVIIGNANDAAVVLAEKISGTEEKFTKKMNETAQQLGMKNTSFTNCNGYYDDDKQLSTAYDLAILCSALAEYDFLKDYFNCWRDFVRNGETELVNANELVKSYKGITVGKAGYTDNSGHCIAIAAERDGVSYISVILGCNEKEDTFSRVKKMLNSAFSDYIIFTPELPKNIPAEVEVKRGLAKTAALEYENVRKVVLPKGAVNTVSSKVVISEYVYAPVEKGRKVGEIQFFRGDKMMFCVDIVAKENVKEINMTKSLGILIKKLLTF